jgi:LysR family transcriptional regulator, nitrogen assimilation regulatory protein
MQFRQLRYFVSIVEAGSFSRAATVVHVAQPALSQQVADLEARLAVELLHRSARGIQPTAAGAILYKEAKVLLQQLDQIPAIVRSTSGEVEGAVNLGIALSIMPKVGGRFLEECRSKCPKIVIQLSDGNSPHLEQRVSSGDLHVAIAFDSGLTASVVRRPLFRQKLYVISKRPLGAIEGSIGLEELSKIPLVLPPRGDGRRDMIDRAFASRNLTHHVALEAGSTSSEMWAVRDEIGSAILPVGDMSHFGPHAFAKPVEIRPPLWMTCSIVQSGNLPLTRAGEALHTHLVNFLACRVSVLDLPGAEWIVKKPRCPDQIG